MTGKKAPSSEGGKLTPKQEAFAAGVANGLSQAEAYRQAFPRSLKWKDESVWSRASALAATDNVRQRVQELREEAVRANQVTTERIVAELAKIAFGDARRVMSWGPGGVVLRESADLDDDEAAIVSEVTETTTATGGSMKLKTHDKLSALKLLADIAGAVVRKTEVTGKNGGPIQTQEVRDMSDAELDAELARYGLKS